MKLFYFIAFLLLGSITQAQELSTFDYESYSFQHPSDWKADQTNTMGTDVIVYSPTVENDSFQENFNIISQDLSGMGLTLDSFISLSLEETEKYVENYELVSNERREKDGQEYQYLSYKAVMYGIPMSFTQNVYLVDDVAYILTFTNSTEDPQFLEVAELLFSSFSLKK